MARFAAEILRLDGSGNVWHHAGDFSTPEGALRSIQRRFPRTQVAARIINRETGEFINVEGYDMVGIPSSPPISDEERRFRQEIEANYLSDDNSFFPELQQQMRAEQQRFRDTERARNFYEERRQQTLRQQEQERDRRLRGFNFTGGDNGLEVRANPRIKKAKLKYKVQWWKDGF